MFPFHLSLAEKVEGRFLPKDTEGFNQVKDKGFLVVVVSMEETDIGIKTRPARMQVFSTIE